MGNNKNSWSVEEDAILEELYKNETKTKDMVLFFSGRTHHAIENRIAKLELPSKLCKIKRELKYDITGEYGIGYTHDGNLFYFDIEDYEMLKEYSWHSDKNKYVTCTYNNKNLKQHRIIMNCLDSDLQVDHINGVPFDNRKQNLRIVTTQQNQMNKGVLSNNTSGVNGVSFSKLKNKWRAYITLNNKQKSLGYYKDKEDAIKARKEAEILYFKDYRRRTLGE